MVWLHTENQLSRFPGSASKVCVGGWLRANLVINFVYSLALAMTKPNNVTSAYDDKIIFA